MELQNLEALDVRLIGKPVEVGVYEKNTENWIGTDAGILTSYTLTPDVGVVTIARSNQEATGTRWERQTQYILITVIK